MDSLKTLLEALPKELYDEILDWTFSPSSTDYLALGPYNMNIYEPWTPDWTLTSAERIIHRANRPLKCLQISRETRQRYAKRYYGNGSIFYAGNATLSTALNEIPSEHVAMIREIRWLGNDPIEKWEWSLADRCEIAMRELGTCFGAMPDESYRLRMPIAMLKYQIPVADGTMKWLDYFELEDLYQKITKTDE